MSNARNLFRAVAMAVCLVFTAEVCAQEADRIAALVKGLASPNRPPAEDHVATRFPANYDKTAQAKVFAAYQALLAEGEAAFPQLTAQLLDERYSATLEGPSTASNYSVGQICGLIIRSHLEAYREQLPRGLGRWRPKFMVVENAKLQIWLQKNKDRKLWELQIQVMDSALEQLLETEPDLLVQNYDANSELVVGALARSIKTVKELRKQIHETKEPLKPKGPIGTERRGLSMLGLPPAGEPAGFRSRSP